MQTINSDSLDWNGSLWGTEKKKNTQRKNGELDRSKGNLGVIESKK